MIRNLCSSVNRYKPLWLSAALLAVGLPAVKAQTVTIFRNRAALTPVYSTVKAAVAAAHSGDSLVLSPHTFSEHDIIVDSSLSFTGTADTSGSSIIDAKGLGRVMRINGKNAEISDLQLTNGAVNNGAGAGIYYLGSGLLRISGKSKITNCRSTGVYSRGGGVFSTGTLLIRGKSTVSGNYAYEDGGGIYAYSSLDMREDVVIENNKADGSGGGIFCEGTGATTLIGQVAIRNNTATVAGGGMFSPATITGSVKITGNKAEFGGGIAALSGDMILRDAVTISGNTATTSGGGIWLNNGSMNADGSFQITGNKIPALTGSYNFGGAIYQINGTMYLRGGNITHNQSPVAAIYSSFVGDFTDSIQLKSCHIYNPKPGGGRQYEIYGKEGAPGSRMKIQGDSCWWGSSGFGPIIGGSTRVFAGISNPVYLKWWLNEGNPIDPAQKTIKMEAYFFIVLAGKLDSLTLRSINTNFTANKGSFTPPVSWIGLNNIASSEYTVPVSPDSIEIVAYVDADTFRSGKFYVAGGLGVKGPEMEQLRVYPNPVSGILSVDGLRPGSELCLYSPDGRLLQRQTVQNAREQCNMSACAPGIYILQLISNDGRKTSLRVQKQ